MHSIHVHVHVKMYIVHIQHVHMYVYVRYDTDLLCVCAFGHKHHLAPLVGQKHLGGGGARWHDSNVKMIM